MAGISLEVFTQVIKVVYVYNCLAIIASNKEKKLSTVVCLVAYLIFHFEFIDYNYKLYIVKNVISNILFLEVAKIKKVERNLAIPYITLILLIYDIVIFVSSISGMIIISFLPPILQEEKRKYIVVILILTFLRVCFVFFILKLIRRKRVYYKNIIISKYGIALGYFFVICAKIPFLYTEIQDGITWKMIFLTIICCTVIFLVISKIDRHNAEEEKARIEENNKILITKLHKSKEILPAVVYALNDIAESGKMEMEEQNTHKLLAEVADLYGLQVKEDSKDDLRLKNFCSTGLTLLDQQLRLYQSEALDRNVNLDILVQAPIDVQMKKNNIDRLRLQRAVGDMVRNAFRAIEREDKKCRSRGHILLIIGCRYENILEIAVVDNGAAFPLRAVESFGRRGITTGGTGNGLADLVEFAMDANASVWLEEFPETEDGFTKKLAIIFDNKRQNFLKSSIREQVDSSFWNTIEL